MIYSTLEGVQCALFPYLGLPTAHTTNSNWRQGRRPPPTITSMKRTIPALAALTLTLGLAACSTDNNEQALETCQAIATGITQAAQDNNLYTDQGQRDYINDTYNTISPFHENSGNKQLDAYISATIRTHVKTTTGDTADYEDNAERYGHDLENIMRHCTTLANK